jgi:spore germination protein GerM
MRRALLLVAMGLLLAGCGIAAEPAAQVINPRSVPSGLMAPASTTTTVPGPRANVVVYLEGQQRLVVANRTVSAPATVRSALSELAMGVTSAESANGLVSPISTATPISLISVHGATAVVNVPDSYANLAGQDQIIAASQIVYTLTLFPEISEVSIRVGGKGAQVPTDTGRLETRPLTRQDFSSVAPL